MLDLLVAFLFGATVSSVLLVAGFLYWFYSQPVTNVPRPGTGVFRPFQRPQLPPHLEEVFSDLNGPDGTQIIVETCRWFNLITDFLFRELRDSTVIKRFIMKKINNEFEEFLVSKTEGRMLEQLTVRDYFLGTSLPIIKDVTVVRIECSAEDHRVPELIDFTMSLDYSGGIEMEIDADLVFNKSAYVAVKILCVKGRARVRFSRLPTTHWSISFLEEPELKMNVDSLFEGRSFPKLSSIIESQIRKFIRKKYTLPSCKMRYKPFFRKTEPQDQRLEVYAKNTRLTVGELSVQVVQCSRLVVMETATQTYCTLSLDSSPYKAHVNLWRTQWPTYEYWVHKDTESDIIGIHYKMMSLEDRSSVVVVDQVFPGTAAQDAGIIIGDVLMRINNVRVSSVKQVDKQIQKTKGTSVLVKLQRPPPHLNTLVTPQRRGGETTPVPLRDEAERSLDFELSMQHQRSVECDSVSLHGVGGERSVGGEELRRRAHTTRQRSATPPELLEVGDPPSTLPRSSSLLVTRESVDQTPPMTRRGDYSHQRQPELSGQSITTKVQASKNTTWNQVFQFKVTDEHNYLNVCVWSKLNDESADLLLGHVTIPLMDIALECLCTSSGNHHQQFVLVAAETVKPSASRATIQAKSMGATNSTAKETSKQKEAESTFAGDIFLRFKHDPQPGEEGGPDTASPSQENIDEPQAFPNHPFTGREGQMPSDHDFTAALSAKSQVCEICRKRMWTQNSRMMCQKCGLKCHRKCVQYCKKEVPCKRGSRVIAVEEFTNIDVEVREPKVSGNGVASAVPVQDGVADVEVLQFSEKDKDSSSSPGEEVSDKDNDHNIHRGLEQSARVKQSLSGSFEMVDNGPAVAETETETKSLDLESSAEIYTPAGSSSSVEEPSLPVKKKLTSGLVDQDRIHSALHEISDIELMINEHTEIVNSLASQLRKEGLTNAEKQAILTEQAAAEEKIESCVKLMKTKIEETNL